VWRGASVGPAERLEELLAELGRRRVTNLVVEGGAGVLRTLFGAGAADEIQVFVAPRLLGGEPTAAGMLETIPPAAFEEIALPGGDLLLRGLLQQRPAARESRTVDDGQR
jgi:riboflavin biosynthesis pyrimidine reductase